MASNPVNPEDLLTPQELAAVETVQTVYTARAKAAAGNLAGLLEIDETATEQLIGKLALKLDNLDFEQRKLVADILGQLATTLGGAAISQPGERPLVAIAEVVDLPVEGTEEPEEGGGKDERPEDDQRNLELAETPKLTMQQRTWFGKVFGEEGVERIAQMNQLQRNSLVEKIAERYLTLKVTRITPAGKQMRIDTLRQVNQGKNYREIADMLNGNQGTIFLGFQTMAGSITSRVSREELVAMLDAHEDEEDTTYPVEAREGDDEAGSPDGEGEPADEPEEEILAELTPEHKRWLTKLLGKEAVAEIEQFNQAKLGFLAERIGHRLDPLIRNRLGPEVTTLRVKHVVSFISGTSVEQLSKITTKTPEGVRIELGSSQGSLSRVDKEDLLRLVEEAKVYQPEN